MITTDVLYVGMTRPTMIGGVTFPAFLANGLFSAVVFLATNNIFYLLVFIPVHGFFYLLCSTEPRIFELANLWSRTKGRNLNRTVWGCSSYSPFESFREKPTREDKKAEAEHKKLVAEYLRANPGIDADKHPSKTGNTL